MHILNDPIKYWYAQGFPGSFFVWMAVSFRTLDFYRNPIGHWQPTEMIHIPNPTQLMSIKQRIVSPFQVLATHVHSVL